METISRDEVLLQKWADQQTIKNLERHAHGACIHIGPISPGCRVCFTGENGGGIQIGQECNCNCSVCYYDRDRDDSWESPTKDIDVLADFFHMSFNPNWLPFTYSYQSAGETLLYIDKFLKFSPLFEQYEKEHKINIYNYMYSNGMYIDDKVIEKLLYLGVREIRFHLSASGWDSDVIENMLKCRDAGITLSVEEPSYPPERQNILDHLPLFEEIGVKHLNLVEVQMTPANKEDIEKEYPEGRIYKDHFYHLYDEGLVYEVMREVAEKGYSFSVLDCNSHVENHRQTKNQELGFDLRSIDGMCADFNYGNRD